MDRKGEDFVSSEQIASSVNTNPVMIRSLLGALRKAKLVNAKEGKGGGVRLSRSAAHISLYDVFKAVEKGPVFRLNDKKESKDCPVSCRMKSILEGVGEDVDAALKKRLGSHSLSDLVTQIEKTSK